MMMSARNVVMSDVIENKWQSTRNDSPCEKNFLGGIQTHGLWWTWPMLLPLSYRSFSHGDSQTETLSSTESCQMHLPKPTKFTILSLNFLQIACAILKDKDKYWCKLFLLFAIKVMASNPKTVKKDRHTNDRLIHLIKCTIYDSISNQICKNLQHYWCVLHANLFWKIMVDDGSVLWKCQCGIKWSIH
jgi:hypothetical protein